MLQQAIADNQLPALEQAIKKGAKAKFSDYEQAKKNHCDGALINLVFQKIDLGSMTINEAKKMESAIMSRLMGGV